MPDGNRLHLQHGPIDLIIEAFGHPEQVGQAYRQATARFETLLAELVQDLPLLRTRVSEIRQLPARAVARRMVESVTPHAEVFITPLAAVAGAVADEILSCLCAGTNLQRAYVNNGGDIALYLDDTRTEPFKIGVVSDPRKNQLVTTATITASDNIKGVATSGRHGRSHSLGIADSVTVFAKSAATADAAATIIANHVNLPGHKNVSRQPANQLTPDSDLGNLPVTLSVGPLTSTEVSSALQAGRNYADHLLEQGTIAAAFLSLENQHLITGWQIDSRPPIVPHLPRPTSTDRITHA
jgi:ApbE superfamily uncharacterized protein (UPF0280 family)